MSHLHTRQEKDCLNCGTIVAGRYCHNCGQENLDPKETTWHLIVHFFNDVTHFDGKFFSSIKYLLIKPGFLTEEYVKGKRASYLNPIRMYLFISAVFFLLMMSVFKGPSSFVKESTGKKEDTSATRKSLSKLRASIDSLEAAMDDEDDDGNIVLSTGSDRLVVTNKDDNEGYKTVREYDSAQKAMPAAERDGFINRYMTRGIIASQESYKKNPQDMKRMLWANYYHSLPYMLFISLPLIALLFKLVYVRRKQFNYVAHGIFTIHFYCFVFIALIVLNTLELCGDWARIIRIVLQIAGIVYLYLAMLRFYKQGKFKTFIKFVIVFGLGTTTIGLLALIFIIKSYLSMGAGH